MSEIQQGVMSAWARRYIEAFGLCLVKIDPREKFPKDQAWNLPGGYFTDAAEAAEFWLQNPQHNMGVVLGPSGVCSLDVDDVPATRQVLANLLGLDVDAMADSLPTVMGNPARFRIMFRAPAGFELGRKALSWPTNGGDPKKRCTVFELRHGLVQDVLPPSIHPDTGKPYTWRTAPDAARGLPELPEELLAIWQNWDIFKRDAQAACPWGPRPEPVASRKPAAAPRSGDSVIEAFNRAIDVEQLLSAHGYKRRGKKWLYAASSTGLPGITVTEGRVYSHHAADPLANGHQNDAFDVFCLLEHGGDVSAATKAAARVLGLEAQRAAATQEPPAPTDDDYANCSADLPGTPTLACGEAGAEQAGARTPGRAGAFALASRSC
ncbi:bifunctional DNA primase/polymerase [Azorhizophilus paspali]|uniref:bifunctional DNA primase/polymerase n=1 Tax=Azorhizophilus paspali TaxID=69963 RepID=UPI003642938A